MSRIAVMTVFTVAVVIFSATAGDEPARRDRGPKDEPREERQHDTSADRQSKKERKERAEKLTPEEREAKRKELRGRLDKRLTELRAKQTNATLSPAEEKELQRCEQLRKRFEQSRKGDKGREPAPGSK